MRSLIRGYLHNLDAFPIRKTAEVHVGKAPGDSEAMGAQVWLGGGPTGVCAPTPQGGSEASDSPAQEEAQEYVGFYGCNYKLVRVGWLGGKIEDLSYCLNNKTKHKRPKQHYLVPCPGCELEHRVQVTWKKLTRNNGNKQVALYDSGREPDIWVGEDE
jgi:hypothetical protein